MNLTYEEILMSKLRQIRTSLEDDYQATLINANFSSLLGIATQQRPNTKQYVEQATTYATAQCDAYKMALDAIEAAMKEFTERVSYTEQSVEQSGGFNND